MAEVKTQVTDGFQRQDRESSFLRQEVRQLTTKVALGAGTDAAAAEAQLQAEVDLPLKTVEDLKQLENALGDRAVKCALVCEDSNSYPLS